MKYNKLISDALLDLAKKSETTFLEVGSEDKELIEAAKKLGIEVPSPDLMVMKTIYAEIDKVNLNGVILPRKAVEEGLQTLVGKQCNWEHDGAGFVCGYTISANIKEDKIETINVLFKSLFPEQADELKEKVKSGEAAVSFEVWNVNPETRESVAKLLDNGNIELSPIIFHGTGVLLIHKPACPKAKIFKLVAKKEIAESKKIEDKLFEQELCFASQAIEEPKCKNCGTCTCEKKEVDIVEEIKAEGIKTETALEVIPEVKVEEAKKKDGDACDMGDGKMGELHMDKDGNMSCVMPEAHKKMHEEMDKSSEETKTEVESTETKPTEVVGAETQVDKTKVEETKEEAEAEIATTEPSKVVKVITEETVTTIEIPNETGNSVETKGNRKCTTILSDGKEEIMTEEYEVVDTYSLAQLEAKISESKIVKDTEIAELKVELEKLDKEIKNLKEELGKKDQEIAEATKVEEKKDKELTVGNVEVKDTEIARRKKEIDNIIEQKHKR